MDIKRTVLYHLTDEAIQFFFLEFSNATNAVVKTIGWLFTGSASLFSEAVHSIADTGNQLILTFGLWQSIKKPNPEHP
jgi:divalent metal cation (Fe/Co/Zn/Cd) transporter